MIYKTKSCPHCGKTYSFMEPEKTGFYGSPFRKCEHCGNTFVDKDFREIAVSGIRRVDKHRVSVQTAFYAVFPAAFLICGLWFGFSFGFGKQAILMSVGGAIFLAGVIWLLIKERSEYDARQRYIEEETKRSKERLLISEYAIALQELGYKVPKEYIKEY